MNGIEPPSRMVSHGLPSNTAALSESNVDSSHGAMTGAFQPSPSSDRDSDTCAPYGTSVVSAFSSAASAAGGDAVGGSRKLSVNVVSVRSTLPASAGSGKPAP